MPLVHTGLQERPAAIGTALPQHAKDDLVEWCIGRSGSSGCCAEPPELPHEATVQADDGWSPEGNRELISVLVFLDAPHLSVGLVE